MSCRTPPSFTQCTWKKILQMIIGGSCLFKFTVCYQRRIYQEQSQCDEIWWWYWRVMHCHISQFWPKWRDEKPGNHFQWHVTNLWSLYVIILKLTHLRPQSDCGVRSLTNKKQIKSEAAVGLRCEREFKFKGQISQISVCISSSFLFWPKSFMKGGLWPSSPAHFMLLD